MVADARINTGLPGHPKTKKLIKRLGAGAAWNLVCLFLWAAENRSDGDLSGLSDEDIELCVNWAGEDGAFVGALRDVGFVDGAELASQIHDWMEHNPWAAGAEMRSAKARWNAAKRHHGFAEADRLVPEYAAIRNASSNADSDATSKNAASETHGNSNAPSPSPSPSPSVVGAKRRKPQVAMPDDFAPNETGTELAVAKHIDVEAELRKFRDYHAAKGSVMADWQAAWRTWVGNARPGTPGANIANGPKRGTDEYAALHRNASWWRDAGFDSVWSAMSAKCWHNTAHQFRDGKRVEVAA